MLAIQREPWDSWWPEGEPLMRMHHLELGTRGVPFRLAHRSIRAGEISGAIRFWTARKDSELIGYIVWYISEHPYSEGISVACQGPWYVLPEHRKGLTGPRLMMQSLDELRNRLGVNIAIPHFQKTENPEGWTRFFARLGGTPLEQTFFLWLRGVK